MTKNLPYHVGHKSLFLFPFPSRLYYLQKKTSASFQNFLKYEHFGKPFTSYLTQGK